MYRRYGDGESEANVHCANREQKTMGHGMYKRYGDGESEANVHCANREEKPRREQRRDTTYAGTATFSPHDTSASSLASMLASLALMAASASCRRAFSAVRASITSACACASASASACAACSPYSSSAYRRGNEEEVSGRANKDSKFGTRTSSLCSRLSSSSSARSRARLRMFLRRKHFHPPHDTYSSYSCRNLVMSPVRFAHCVAREG